jgi:hypothetical protein
MTRERAMTRKDAIDELREIQEIGGSDGRPSLGGRCPMGRSMRLSIKVTSRQRIATDRELLAAADVVTAAVSRMSHVS